MLWMEPMTVLSIQRPSNAETDVLPLYYVETMEVRENITKILYVICHMSPIWFSICLPKKLLAAARSLVTGQTLWYQDISVSNHFGTNVSSPKCPDQFGISAEVSPDTLASVPKCLQPLRHWYRIVHTLCNHLNGNNSDLYNTRFHRYAHVR